MDYTVLGASGFIGKHVAEVLRRRGYAPFCPGREEDTLRRNLGTVFYCIGLTADFRQKSLETIDAHVCILNSLLRRATFERMIYLSSARVYNGLNGTVNEDARLIVNPNDPSDLYNISKLMGESACFNSGRDTTIARLSNVVGPDFSSDNFIFTLIREACDTKFIRLRSAAQSAKDYILLKDAVEAIVALGEHRHPKPIYNIASGRNLSSEQICKVISETEDCRWEAVPAAPLFCFPDIDISRARKDLGLVPGNVLESLKDLVCQYRQNKGVKYEHTN